MNNYTIHDVHTSDGIKYELYDNRQECIVASFYEYDLALSCANYLNGTGHA